MNRSEGSILLYVLMVFLVVGLAILIFFNFRANTDQMAQIEAAAAAAAVTPTPEPTATPAPTPEPVRTTESVSLVFAGDIVGQAGLTTDAESADDGDDGEKTVSYDYSDELSGILTSLDGADFAACTIVGTLSDGGPYDEGYRMNSAMAKALAGAGFRLVNLATDHILDQGLEGLRETVDAIDDEGLAVSGAYENAQTHAVYMAELHGVQVAFLGYTYGTGGVSVADNAWCVDILTEDYMTGQETVDYARIDTDISAVRSAGADIVVCFVYWWDSTQYYTAVRDNQEEVVDHLIDSGADIIIGGGVKAPQPIETRVAERDGVKANCVVCYSLSNLMSCFNDRYTNLSAAARIEICRDTETGEAWVDGVSYRPLFMLDTDDYGGYSEPGYKYRLLDAYDAIAAYEDGGKDISTDTYDAILTGVADLQAILGEQYDTENGGVTMGYPY